MAIVFTLGLFLYYWCVLRRHAKNGATLAVLLWLLYVCLGLSGIFLALTNGIEPIFEPNYLGALFLLLCVVISISGFLRFREHDISQIFGRVRGQKIIENVLIFLQLFAILYFLPFAISSLMGDANENRLFLSEKMEVMGAYGFVNTAAGAASQLFSSSIVLAFIRLSSRENHEHNILRAFFLLLSSLSYVIYILAYVGRDGVVYWLMTSAMIFLIFRRYIDPVNIGRIYVFGFSCAVVILIPFGVITVSRFFDADQGAGWSFFEYFGAQIHNFSDYSTIDRPLTLGLQSFPMVINAGCSILGLSCPSWLDVKDGIFEQYLDQGKAPWLFGTFISDWVGDFGLIATFILLSAFSLFCAKVCSDRGSKNLLSLARLLLIILMYLVPYWGVFYFRFAISNGYIVVNLIFILLVVLLHKMIPEPAKK